MLSRLIILMLAVVPVFAQDSKTLDLSTVQAKKTFYVVFAARGGSATGHAFVVWGVEDGVHKRSTVRAFGLYPENESGGCSAMVRNVPGRVMDEMVNHSVQAITTELIVRVDEDDFNRSLKVARAWDCRHEFALLGRDCVEFVRAIGKSLDLNMPRRYVTRWAPQAYIRALLASVSEGTVQLPGAVYQGSLMDSKPLGHGVLEFGESRIEGAFRGPDYHRGSGELLLADGRRYEGGIVDYQAHGKGIVYQGAKKIAAGEFKDGLLQNARHRVGPLQARPLTSIPEPTSSESLPRK